MSAFSTPGNEASDDMSVASAISTASTVGITDASIIARLDQAVQSGVVKKGFFIHMTGSESGMYRVDAKVGTGVSNRFF